ncbi:peptidoglycan-binding protein, partial [Pararhodobacter sp. SW119]|uniref:peptidoglycan-binding domain-containing protein n=1 Tax=Pararhodobacter sp. SW119 TaxID=2780075 RepID=UPI001AE016E0
RERTNEEIAQEQRRRDEARRQARLALLEAYDFRSWSTGQVAELVNIPSASLCTRACTGGAAGPATIRLVSIEKTSDTTISFNFTIATTERNEYLPGRLPNRATSDYILFVKNDSYSVLGYGDRVIRRPYAEAIHLVDEKENRYRSMSGIEGLRFSSFNQHAFRANLPFNSVSEFYVSFPIPEVDSESLSFVFPGLHGHQAPWQLTIFDTTRPNIFMPRLRETLDTPVSETVEPEPAVHDEALGRMRPAEVMSLQRTLAELGFDPGPVNGIIGPSTRNAIRQWQRSQGHPVTGSLTRGQFSDLNASGETGVPAEADRDDVLGRMRPSEVMSLQRTLAELGFDPGPVDGIIRHSTRNAIRQWQRAQDHPVTGSLTRGQFSDLTASGETGVPAEADRDDVLGRMRLDEVMSLQRTLAELGFDPGPVNGIIGPSTRNAIRQWQRSQGHPVTGSLTRGQYNELKGFAEVVEPAEPDRDEVLGRMGAFEVLELQLTLIDLGFDVRPPFGDINSSTRNAIREWQNDQGFEVTGNLTENQLRLLAESAE